jgi:hypothetical protein
MMGVLVSAAGVRCLAALSSVKRVYAMVEER